MSIVECRMLEFYRFYYSLLPPCIRVGITLIQHIKCATNKVTIANPSDQFKPSLSNFKFDNIHSSFVNRHSSGSSFVTHHIIRH